MHGKSLPETSGLQTKASSLGERNGAASEKSGSEEGTKALINNHNQAPCAWHCAMSPNEKTYCWRIYHVRFGVIRRSVLVSAGLLWLPAPAECKAGPWCGLHPSPTIQTSDFQIVLGGDEGAGLRQMRLFCLSHYRRIQFCWTDFTCHVQTEQGRTYWRREQNTVNDSAVLLFWHSTDHQHQNTLCIQNTDFNFHVSSISLALLYIYISYYTNSNPGLIVQYPGVQHLSCYLGYNDIHSIYIHNHTIIFAHLHIWIWIYSFE